MDPQQESTTEYSAVILKGLSVLYIWSWNTIIAVYMVKSRFYINVWYSQIQVI